MKKRRIIIIIDNLSVGGGQRVVMELAKNIDLSRYCLKVICSGVEQFNSVEESIRSVCDIEFLNLQGRVKATDIFKVMKCISKFKPDIVHAHLGGVTYAVPWSILHRKPLVVTAHTIPEKAFSKKNEMQLKAGLMLGNTMLVAVSEENHNKCKEYFNLSNIRCRCVNNGVDTDKYKQKKHDGFRFINVATHNENKNQGSIIICFAKLRKIYDDVFLTLVGDGPLHKEYQELATSLNLGDSIEFTGQSSSPEDYYEKSDVYIQASHREAMPMSVLEGIAAGLPVISTDVGGLADVVKENGILVKDGDSDGLFNAMKTMREASTATIEKMKNISKSLSHGYSSTIMTEQYMSIYDEMIKRY